MHFKNASLVVQILIDARRKVIPFIRNTAIGVHSFAFQKGIHFRSSKT